MNYQEKIKDRKQDLADWSKKELNIELTEWQLDFLFARQLGTTTARLVRLLYRIVHSEPKHYTYVSLSHRGSEEVWHKIVHMMRGSEDIEKITKTVIRFKNGSTLDFISSKTPKPKNEREVSDEDFVDYNDLAYTLPQMG